MKIMLRAAAVLLLAAAPLGAYAQEVERAEMLKQRQAIVEEVLDLTDEEALAFWPAYRDYRVEMAGVGDRAVKLIKEFVASSSALSDAQATRMVDEFLAIQADRVSVRQKHVKAFRKALPPTKVARFLQLENKMDAVLDHELAMTVPLALEP